MIYLNKGPFSFGFENGVPVKVRFDGQENDLYECYDPPGDENLTNLGRWAAGIAYINITLKKMGFQGTVDKWDVDADFLFATVRFS